MPELVDLTARVMREQIPPIIGSRYELRDDQIDMAVSVARTLEGGGVALIEAPTGIGKSLAYLVPALLYSRENRARVVVATYTRNLQRQLATRDFELASSAVGGGVAGAVLMGRTSYPCRRAIAGYLLENSPGSALAAWLRNLADRGTDLESFPGSSVYLREDLRVSITCPSRELACRGCAERPRCALMNARREAVAAGLVMVNHALLFADRQIGGGLLGEFDAVIVDEAHHLEDVATDFFTVSFSRRVVRGGPHSLLTADLEEAADGVRLHAAREGTEGETQAARLWTTLQSQASGAHSAVGGLFDAVDRRVPANASERSPYAEGSPLLYDAAEYESEIRSGLRGVARAAVGLREMAPDPVNGGPDYGGVFDALAGQAVEASDTLEFLTAGSDEDYVFFVNAGRNGSSALSAAPVEVGPRLGAFLDDSGRAAVLTSATLAVGDAFDYTVGRLGLQPDRTRRRRYESPFRLEENRTVHVTRWMPQPGDKTFPREAAGLIGTVQRALGRRHLVLATSRAQAAAVTRHLASCEGVGERLFSQTDGGSRTELLDGFRDCPGAVLVGLASFWEGVDLPGSEVEIVSILRVPFRVPDDPVVRARSEKLREHGEDPFQSLFIPDAILRLRQGIGRLIRTGSDRGAVILLDSRVATAWYGAPIASAAAGCCHPSSAPEELISGLSSFFDDGAA